VSKSCTIKFHLRGGSYMSDDLRFAIRKQKGRGRGWYVLDLDTSNDAVVGTLPQAKTWVCRRAKKKTV
jgi:hypothetical protein